MKQEQDVKQNLQSFAVENQNKENSSEELLEREAIEGTPFYIVGNHDIGYFLTLGKHRLTEPDKDILSVYSKLKNNMWDIILKLVITSHQLVAEEIMKSQNK